MMLNDGPQIIAIHILLNTQKVKAINQTMKLGQLIDYKMRNTFLEKSYTKCRGKTISRTFSRKSELNISLDQQSKVLQSLLLLYTKLRAINIYGSCKPLAFTLHKACFFKKQEVWNQSHYLLFCMIFEEKYFSRYVLLTDQDSLRDCLYLLRYWAIRVL